MRTDGEVNLQSVFSSSIHPRNSPVITQIREFAQCRADDIRKELSFVRSTGDKWILDLTHTSLFTLLAHWGTEFAEITAICDQSKPLEQDQSMFDIMIGRKERLFADVFEDEHPLTFNLTGPIELADSRVAHGIQIADAVAAAMVYVFSGADDDYATRWKELVPTIGCYGSIIPDHSEIDLGGHRAQLNALLLLELHERAKKGESLTEGISEYAQVAAEKLQTFPMWPNARLQGAIDSG